MMCAVIWCKDDDVDSDEDYKMAGRGVTADLSVGLP